MPLNEESEMFLQAGDLPLSARLTWLKLHSECTIYLELYLILRNLRAVWCFGINPSSNSILLLWQKASQFPKDCQHKCTHYFLRLPTSWYCGHSLFNEERMPKHICCTRIQNIFNMMLVKEFIWGLLSSLLIYPIIYISISPKPYWKIICS